MKSSRIDQEGHPEQDAYQPRVIVKISESHQLNPEVPVEEAFRAVAPDDWKRLPDFTIERLFPQSTDQGFANLIEQAQENDPTYRPRQFANYVAISVPDGVDLEAVRRVFSELGELVETAYFEPPPAPPPAPSDNVLFGQQGQGHLRPAPGGINAEHAWGLAGGAGQNQAFVDVEVGWKLDHEDLPKGISRIGAGLNHSQFAHGTGVLGIVAAEDNHIGGIGIVHQLASHRVAGQWRPNGVYSTSQPIMEALLAMSPGDVLLLEAQARIEIAKDIHVLVPVEVELAVFDVIRLATAKGIVVVEAAGNGIQDLDTVPVFDPESETMGYGLNRNNVTDFRDSGAILVAAASAAHPHRRRVTSNYGSRIDCYAWGEQVTTCWTDGSASSHGYTHTFAGTSSAAAIIAGAALAVQGLAEAQAGYRFSPWYIRLLLSHPALGTLSENSTASNPNADGIGVMPDLREISRVLDLRTPA